MSSCGTLDYINLGRFVWAAILAAIDTRSVVSTLMVRASVQLPRYAYHVGLIHPRQANLATDLNATDLYHKGKQRIDRLEIC